jgi:MFS superfamily sulfate permease-like transporter
MPTQIKQIDDPDRGITIFRVEGDMLFEDAILLGRIAKDQQEDTGNSITIDLADLDFLDSDSAPILKRLESEHGFEIIGTEIFLQSLVNAAEKR